MISTLLRKTESVFHRYVRPSRLAHILNQKQRIIRSYLEKIEHDQFFFKYIQDKMQKNWRYSPSKHDFEYSTESGSIFFPCTTLYAVMRAIQPLVVVETGGTPGKSSAAILKALQDNNLGHLYTLDLPPQVTNVVCNSSQGHTLRPLDEISCWAIEPSLRDRHSLILGDTKETLLPLLQQLKTLDVFIHDSDHSYDFMMFEFTTAWSFIRPGGLLMSDDVSTNNSFVDFAKLVQKKPHYVGNYGFLIK